MAAFPGRSVDPLFPSGLGEHYKHSNFHRSVFNKVRAAAGVKVTRYMLRHTMATLLIQAGVPLKVVSERLGHEDVATTLRNYAHVMDGDQERAAIRMEEILNHSVPRLPHGTELDSGTDKT